MEKVYRTKDMPLLKLEQSFIEKFHTYLSHDLGMSPNGFVRLSQMPEICGQNGFQQRLDGQTRPYATIVDAELNPNLQTIGQHSNSRHSESKPIYFAVNERAITSIRLGGTTKVRFGRYIGNVLKPFFNLRQSRSWQIPN